MTICTNNRFNISAFAIASLAFLALHGSMLMGFEQLASREQKSVDNGSRVAKTIAAPRTLVLERVVISNHRV